MEQNYKLNILIKFLYRETDIFETLEIEDAIEHDFFLAEELQLLKDAFLQLPSVRFSPTKNTMANILSFSQNGQLNTAC